MDIYKLSDFDGEKPQHKLKITALKQGLKNPDRVNVFVDEKYAFSLDVSQVVDLKIKVGKEITEDELNEFKKASEYGKLYQKTLEWVLVRPRSEKETKDYLFKKLRMSSSDTLPRARLHGARSLPVSPAELTKSSEDIAKFSQTIIDKLITRCYLDDKAFAKWYVENRFVKKGISQRRLKMELMKKGVSKEIIDEVLGARNDEEEILKIIAKKRAKYDDEKLINYLCRQGFSYELVQDLVRNYEKD